MRTEKRDLGFAFGTLVLISWRPFGFEWRDFDGLEALHIVVHVSRMAREICHGSESGCAEVVRRPSVAACRLPTPFCVSQPVFLQPRCSYVQAPAPLPACNVFSASFGARCCCCKSFAFCCRPPKTRRHPCISCLQGCRCMHSLQSELSMVLWRGVAMGTLHASVLAGQNTVTLCWMHTMAVGIHVLLHPRWMPPPHGQPQVRLGSGS